MSAQEIFDEYREAYRQGAILSAKLDEAERAHEDARKEYDQLKHKVYEIEQRLRLALRTEAEEK